MEIRFRLVRTGQFDRSRAGPCPTRSAVETARHGASAAASSGRRNRQHSRPTGTSAVGRGDPFRRKDLSQWSQLNGTPPGWVVKDGCMEAVAGSGYVRTLRNFGDCQLHVEWAAPTNIEGEGQGRGNSGVFLMTKYEVQVLDSWDNDTYADGAAAAVYGQYPPLALPCRPPGEWQTYDIVFTRPRFASDGKLVSPARVTVLYNGVLVQNNVELTGPTGWLERAPYTVHDDKLPIALQDHGNPVRYRNVWVRDLERSTRPEFTYPADVLDALTGRYQVRPDFQVVIERQEGQLRSRLVLPDREIRQSLVAASKTLFFVRATDIDYSFQLDNSGKASQVTLKVGRSDITGRRMK